MERTLVRPFGCCRPWNFGNRRYRYQVVAMVLVLARVPAGRYWQSRLVATNDGDGTAATFGSGSRKALQLLQALGLGLGEGGCSLLLLQHKLKPAMYCAPSLLQPTAHKYPTSDSSRREEIALGSLSGDTATRVGISSRRKELY
jgi:hypothetical protein